MRGSIPNLSSFPLMFGTQASQKPRRQLESVPSPPTPRRAFVVGVLDPSARKSHEPCEASCCYGARTLLLRCSHYACRVALQTRLDGGGDT